jgi:hypothetical protein
MFILKVTFAVALHSGPIVVVDLEAGIITTITFGRSANVQNRKGLFETVTGVAVHGATFVGILLELDVVVVVAHSRSVSGRSPSKRDAADEPML